MVRSESGNLIWAMADYYGIASDMSGEAKALMQRLEKCYEDGFYRGDVKADSLVFTNTRRAAYTMRVHALFTCTRKSEHENIVDSTVKIIINNLKFMSSIPNCLHVFIQNNEGQNRNITY